MSGFVFMVASCAACGVTIMCNPNMVPSLRVAGVREPICRGCFDRWNEIHRVSKGLEPVEPQAGAYECAEVGEAL